MAQQLQIEIPSACHENWQNMNERANGRYCGSCQKTVVDFTNMSDAALADHFRNYTGGTCGRFNNDQLNRVLALPRKPLPGLRYFFTMTLPALFWSVKSAAQTAALPEVQVATPQRSAAQPAEAAAAKRQVSGVVFDENGAPIPFATVTESGTRNAVTADANGVFQIRLLQGRDGLTISSSGYLTHTMQREHVTAGAPIRVELTRRAGVLNEVVVVAGYVSVRRTTPAKKKEVPAPVLHIFPNPVRPGETVQVSGESITTGTYLLQLYSASGALLRSADAEWKAKGPAMQLETGNLPPGTYVLRALHTKSGKTLSQQVVLQ